MAQRGVLGWSFVTLHAAVLHWNPGYSVRITVEDTMQG